MKLIQAIPTLVLLAAATALGSPQSGQDDGKQQPKQEQQGQQQRPPDARGQQPQQQQRPPNAQAQQPQQQRQKAPDARGQQPPQQQRGQSDIRARQPPPQRSQDQARAWQQQKGWVQKGGWQGHTSWQQNRAHDWANQHQTWGQRGGYGGYYIPQNVFVLSFGSNHFFRMMSRPTMFMGYPRFRYGGFSFLLVDPWPEYWSEDWYATDDLYVDYDGGYYLYNRRYPGAGLAITVVL